MKLLNDADRLKKELLTEVIKSYYNKNLLQTIDHLPIQMRPKEMEASRCCIYKDRAILKYRIMAALGFGIENETDETFPLSYYARLAFKRQQLSERIISVLDIACHGCIESRYLVTSACRGCLARPCMNNCPKKCIGVHNGQARINHEACINCGKCLQVCPYHAIIRVPIPCEEACPVNAIYRNNSGKQEIDFDACISCGKCLEVCPFGAVLERSHIIDVMSAIQADQHVVAMVAPSIIGQFREATLHQVTAAIQLLGFKEMEEVAFGAEETTRHEAEEFFKRMTAHEHLMTSSCCPAYTEAVKRHLPELQPFVSETFSPMYYTAEAVKKRTPQAITVFIGPCIAKKKEAQSNTNVDYVLTFEELDAWLSARDIEPASLAGCDIGRQAEGYARGFATSCGVSAAILQSLYHSYSSAHAKDELPELDSKFINGLDRKSIKQLKLYAAGKLPANFLEVMSCEGGCVGGPCAIGKLTEATKAVKQAARI